MKVGDLIKLPQGLGYDLVLRIIDSKPGMEYHPYQTVVPLDESLGPWDADACEVISESR